MTSSLKNEMPEDWYQKALEEAKLHLTPEEMQNFVFTPDDLDQNKLSSFKTHTSECTRCKTRFQKINSNKKSFVTSPTLEF